MFRLFLTLSLLVFFVTPAYANDPLAEGRAKSGIDTSPVIEVQKSELQTAYERCQRKHPGTPYEETFQNLKGVGVTIGYFPGNAPEKKTYKFPALLNRDHLVEAFGKRIKEQILPFLIPDENCKIPDLRVFDRKAKDRFYLQDFVDRDDTLTINIRVQVVEPPKSSWLASYFSNRRPVIILSYNYFRPSVAVLPSTANFTLETPRWKIYSRARDAYYGRTAFPMDADDDEINSRIAEVVDTIFVDTDLTDKLGEVTSHDHSEYFKKMRDKAMREKPPDVLISLPDYEPTGRLK